jgi:hypothetical protein
MGIISRILNCKGRNGFFGRIFGCRIELAADQIVAVGFFGSHPSSKRLALITRLVQWRGQEQVLQDPKFVQELEIDLTRICRQEHQFTPEVSQDSGSA